MAMAWTDVARRKLVKTTLIAIGVVLIAWNLAQELDDLHKVAVALQSAGLPALIVEGYRSFKKMLQKKSSNSA